MTYKDLLRQVHPELVDDVKPSRMGCPSDYGFEHPDICPDSSCADCWKREAVINCKVYELDVLRTAPSDVSQHELLEQGIVGLSGEAGECIDIYKKFRWRGHDIDTEHLALELGDVAWYLTLTAHAIGYTLEEILTMNIEKRKKRYPNGFDSGLSVNRESTDI